MNEPEPQSIAKAIIEALNKFDGKSPLDISMIQGNEWAKLAASISETVTRLASTAENEGSGRILGDGGTQIQNPLEEMRNIYDAVVESTDDAIIAKNLDGILIAWNPAAEAMFGYKAQEVIGKHNSLIVPEDRREEASRMMEEVRHGNKPKRFETIRVDRRGKRLEVSITVSPIKSPSGNIVGVSKIVRDMTIERQAEDFRDIVIEAMPVGMVVVDADGKILMVNEEAERLFGYSPSELMGRGVELLVPANLVAEHKYQRAAFITRPEKRRMGMGRDLFGVKKDGRRVPLEIGFNPISTPNGVIVLCAIVDITERKRTAQIIIDRSLQLKRANRRLSEFALLVSHDLKAPLLTVLGYSKLCLAQSKELLGRPAREHLSRIAGAAERMQEMIGEIRRFSEGDSHDSSFEIVNVAKVVQEMLADVKFIVENAGAVVEVGHLPAAWGQATLLRQVFQNLVENAIKFRRVDSIPVIRLDAEIVDGMVRFAVKDNGIGIPPEAHERIFQIFERLHESSGYEGSGIGLAICKRIVRRLGGRIWVDSEVGKGSTFYFLIPESGAKITSLNPLEQGSQNI